VRRSRQAKVYLRIGGAKGEGRFESDGLWFWNYIFHNRIVFNILTDHKKSRAGTLPPRRFRNRFQLDFDQHLRLQLQE
jgi:hypothetical protein